MSYFHELIFILFIATIRGQLISVRHKHFMEYFTINGKANESSRRESLAGEQHQLSESEFQRISLAKKYRISSTLEDRKKLAIVTLQWRC